MDRHNQIIKLISEEVDAIMEERVMEHSITFNSIQEKEQYRCNIAKSYYELLRHFVVN